MNALAGGMGRWAAVGVALAALVIASQNSAKAAPGKGDVVASTSPSNHRTEESDDPMVVVLTPEAATVGCGSACDGKDPETLFKPVPADSKTWFRCSFDAETVLEYRTNPYDVLVELRYSPHCRSAWARGWMRNAFRVDSFKNGVLRRREDWQPGPSHSGSPDHYWTRMVNDKNLFARACSLQSYHWLPTDHEAWRCTGRF